MAYTLQSYHAADRLTARLRVGSRHFTLSVKSYHAADRLTARLRELVADTLHSESVQTAVSQREINPMTETQPSGRVSGGVMTETQPSGRVSGGVMIETQPVRQCQWRCHDRDPTHPAVSVEVS